ncbi:MAG: thioesterase family protein [Actinomycetota bacterium]|nr:thioesterase family protein [Actinomycetota bacterium]
MSGPSEHPALFVPEGGDWLPTAHSRGPWSAESLHGGPVAALLTRAVEQVDAPIPARLTRVTVELFRPVPLVPLRVTTEVLRPGAKVATLEATLSRVDDGQVLARARAQRIRAVEIDFPDGAVDEVPDLPGVASDLSHWPGAEGTAFHSTAVEHRILRGEFGRPGPVFDWVRLRVPVVPDEEPSGWQRAVATADFANGLSAVVPFDGTSMFINPDLTVHLWREPTGEWIGTDAVTRTSTTGVGMSDATLWDLDGRIGRGMQSLLLDRF